MNKTTTALLLKTQAYKETASIVTALTKEYGKVSLVAAGTNKMNSKNAGSLLPYTEAEITFSYAENKTMFRLLTAHTKNLYRYAHEDLKAQSALALCSEVTEEMLETPSEEASYLYDLLKNVYDMLNEKKEPLYVTALFLSEILTIFGMRPNVEGCVYCANEKVYALSIEEGGFVCRDCAKKLGLLASPKEELQHFRWVTLAKLQNYDALVDQIPEIGSIVKKDVGMLRREAGIPIRSYRFFERIFG